MLRFCDNEVSCVLDMEMDRHEILDYFFQGHMDDIVCVFDIDGNYKGRITYHALINTNDISDAVQEDFVVLDQNIWQNARNYFSHYKSRLNEHVLLPVVDKAGMLLCFAYEDPDANREIRMLRELSENSDALQFSDLYPQYTTVKIYEFNELAYFFAKYLESQNINVQVAGELWDGFFEGTEHQELADKCMTIYAEGTGRKKADWVDNLLESVCVEFECVDRIYEANIKNQVFKDACGSIEELLKRLEKETEIVILGSGREAQDVYNFLTEHHIDSCCFVNENYGERSHRMFGKEILSSLNARMKYENPVFIECVSEHSSWGFGGVDDYDYMGYKRNEKFFLIRDHIVPNSNSLINLLRKRKVVLIGNVELCARLYHFLSRKKVGILGYLSDEKQNTKHVEIETICMDEIDLNKDVTALYVDSEFFQLIDKQKQNEKKRNILSWLKGNGLEDYTDYFSHVSSFIEIESQVAEKYTKKFLMPKRIVIGSIELGCGNTFFRYLLEDHPCIMILDSCELGNRLFWICVRLSEVRSKQILELFWQICETEKQYRGIYNTSAFNEKMQQLLETGDRFSSQELFVMFHITFMYMKGWNLSCTDIKKLIIYWEPHHMNRMIEEDFVNWLGMKNIRCDVINVVRNIVMQKGGIKYVYRDLKDRRQAYGDMLDYPNIEKKDYLWGDRLVIRFEDLKCDPKRILTEICRQWEIGWSDTLMMTTHNGKAHSFNEVTGFDLKPVYNLNETYFSEFDRFRIMLINGPWQKKYGYPYIKITDFTTKELQEMFMKRFRFEWWIDFYGKVLEREHKIVWCRYLRNKIVKLRMLEFMESE